MTIDSDINADEGPQLSPDVPTSNEEKNLDGDLNDRKLTRFRSVFSKFVNRIDRIFGELTAVILGLAIVSLWILNSVLERQSTDLTLLRPNIKMWFADSFDGRDTEFGRLELSWEPYSGNVVVAIEDAEVYGREGEVVESFDLIRSNFSIDSDFKTRPRLRNAQIKGGVITYREDNSGNIVAGLGPPEKVGLIEPVYRSENVWNQNSDFRKILQGFEFIQIEDAQIYFQNESAGVNLKSDITKLRANFSDSGGLSVTAAGFVDQKSGAMPFTVDSITDTQLENIRLKLKVEDARLDEIVPTTGRFWEFKGLAAPLDLTADIDFSKREGLRSASVDIDIGAGKFTLYRGDNLREFPLESLVARASLAPGDERMDLQALDLNAPNLSFKSSGFFTELGNLNDGNANSSPVFSLSLQDIRADMTPIFANETKVKGLDLIGQVDADSRSLDVFSGKLNVFETAHTFDGKMSLRDNNTLKSISLNSSMSGVLTVDQFISLWPTQSFKAARHWVGAAILETDLTQLDAELNFDEAFFETPVLTEKQLKFLFTGQDTNVKYMQTMPVATKIAGRGEIIGNRLEVQLDSGQVNGVDLTGGSVVIPKLRTKQGELLVRINGTGSVADIIRLADHEPYNIASRYNVDPNGLKGAGDVTLELQRPLVSYPTPDQIDYQITGAFRGANLPFDIGQHQVDNGDLSLDVNKQRVLIKGPVNIGPWRAETHWLETLDDEAALTEYGVTGVIDADVLDQFGLGSRTWFDGEATVRIDAKGRGTNIENANLDVDLTHSALSLEGLWMKPIGETGKLSGQLKRNSDGGVVIENGDLTGANIHIRGEMSVQSDYKLLQMDLSKMSIPSLIDGAVKITPDRIAGILDVELDATYLNVSPWTDDLFAERKSNLDVPLKMKGFVKELVLDENYVVTDSELYFSHTGEVIETARLEALSDEKPLKLELSTRDDFNRHLDINVPDASKAVLAFMGLDNTKGGRLKISVDLPAAGEDGAFTGTADMRDFTVIEAPAFAQLLSVASLTGLADTLSSGSMQFEKFKVPFTMLGDNIAIRDARLYGPALGMTGDGDIDLKLRVLDFDGTLVPAYKANSILGDIPLLGDIFVQEKDGGLFALTYTVSGPFERTQVAVNPLSALTPGFLRRIFKRDRSEVDDAMREAIADVQPKVSEAP